MYGRYVVGTSLTTPVRMIGHGVAYCLKIFGVTVGVRTWCCWCPLQDNNQNFVWWHHIIEQNWIGVWSGSSTVRSHFTVNVWVNVSSVGGNVNYVSWKWGHVVTSAQSQTARHLSSKGTFTWLELHANYFSQIKMCTCWFSHHGFNSQFWLYGWSYVIDRYKPDWPV
jgi:hypothetical protein